MNLDTHEVAWAAGFFDGEGSTFASTQNRTAKNRIKNPKTSVRIAIVQRWDNVEVLERFKRIVGVGAIYGPGTRAQGMYQAWRFEQSQAVIAMLWKYLGSAKRQQAKKALITYLECYKNPSSNTLRIVISRKCPGCGRRAAIDVCNNCGYGLEI
jgi:hypothetical protein